MDDDLTPWEDDDRSAAYREIAELSFHHAQRAILAGNDRDASCLTALANTLHVMAEAPLMHLAPWPR